METTDFLSLLLKGRSSWRKHTSSFNCSNLEETHYFHPLIFILHDSYGCKPAVWGTETGRNIEQHIGIWWAPIIYCPQAHVIGQRRNSILPSLLQILSSFQVSAIFIPGVENSWILDFCFLDSQCPPNFICRFKAMFNFLYFSALFL